jgi:hypothetical protein
MPTYLESLPDAYRLLYERVHRPTLNFAARILLNSLLFETSRLYLEFSKRDKKRHQYYKQTWLYLHISTDLKKIVTRLKLQFAIAASNIYFKRNFE